MQPNRPPTTIEHKIKNVLKPFDIDLVYKPAIMEADTIPKETMAKMLNMAIAVNATPSRAAPAMRPINTNKQKNNPGSKSSANSSLLFIDFAIESVCADRCLTLSVTCACVFKAVVKISNDNIRPAMTGRPKRFYIIPGVWPVKYKKEEVFQSI